MTARPHARGARIPRAWHFAIHVRWIRTAYSLDGLRTIFYCDRCDREA